MQDARWITLVNKRNNDNHFARLAGSSFVLLVAVAGIFLCAGQATVLAGLANETVVRLYPSAVVVNDEVTLADIAELEGVGAQLAGRWTIASGMQPGSSRVVDLSRVQKVLARRGANLASWVFRGSTKCTITRPHEVTDNQYLRSGTADKNRYRVRGGSAAGSAHKNLPKINPNTLEGVLWAYLAERLSAFGGTPVIAFNPGIAQALKLSRPTYDFQIIERSKRLLGHVAFEINVLEKGKVTQVVQVLAEVGLRKSVVVVCRPVNRGEVLKATDLVVEDRMFTRIGKTGLSDPTRLVGQRAKRFIAQGVMIEAKDIEPLPLIQRNDSVTVWLKGGNMKIKMVARAVENAAYGECVELKNQVSKQTFTAVVTGPKTAEVVLGNSSFGQAALSKGDR